jgi:glycine/D-amino acid oxidase-like deaminating enzyme
VPGARGLAYDPAMPASLWQRESAPLGTASAPPRQCDVAVIGGGIAGISTALHLAQQGAEAGVMEAEQVAARASGRNDGQLLLGLGEHYHRIVGQFGADKARLLWDFIRDNNGALKAAIAEHRIACDLVDGGGLRLAETPHEAIELADAAAQLRQHSVPHELLSPAGVRARVPAAEGFFGALWLPGEAIVQPVAMVRGLAHAAAAAGALVCEGQRVTAIRGSAGDFELLLASGAALRAGVVVHCTSTLARDLDGSGFLQRQVFPFRGQVLATDALPARIAAALPGYAMSSNFCYEYFRVHRDRFVIGGMRWSVKGEETGILDDQGHNPEVTANLLAYVRRHFPILGDVPFPHVWTGIMAGTPDGLPLLGSLPGQPGVFALLAFNGYGLSFAFLAARCLAEQILEGRAGHPGAELFAPRRLRPAP